ncbi:uncharacterized protein [Haliotis asinina]|uniref:uncharacterized protein n=1 Tax=Haliotis asinina TaxID=109174 RepID=UPI00353254FF
MVHRASSYAVDIPPISYDSYLLSSVNDMSFKNVLNTSTGVAILHCNVFCKGTTLTQFTNRGCFPVNPVCKTCRCDDECKEYGDCCPDDNLNVTVVKENRHACVSGRKGTFYFTGSHPGYYMIYTCPEEPIFDKTPKISVDDLSPVTSVTTNITYLNEGIARCHGVQILIRWRKQIVCHKKTKDLEIEGGCKTAIHPPAFPQPRPCHAEFTSDQYIDSCNSTWLLNTSFSSLAEEQCRHGIYYPVSRKTDLFKNIFCYMCNGFSPSHRKCDKAPLLSKTDINDLICTKCDRPTCREVEWYDRIKNTCRAMHCRSGYFLKGGKCQLTDVGLSRVKYQIAVLFWPTGNNTSDPRLQDWNFIEPVVVSNIPLVAEQYNMTYYMFSIYELVHINIDNSSKHDSVPSFGLTLTFRTNQTCCRDAFEETMVTLLEDIWSMEFNGSVFQFRLSRDDFYTYGVTKRQLYKMHPPFTSPQKTEEDDIVPSEVFEEYVYLPAVLPQCSYVQFSVDEFIWNTDSSISLRYVDITIQHDRFIKMDEYNLVICVDTIDEVYSNYQDPVKLAKHISTLIFSILSLICLALTFITYCTFPSLLTLPTKNTMCLVAFLFLAQLLLMFKGMALWDETACKIVGVFLHYLWLTVILWMNVCSYHMFHVFVVDVAKPIGTQSHRSRLVKYSLYANGLSLLIVLITIFSNLGMSSGRHIGYGIHTCYLSTSFLVGVAFVAPLSIVLIMNIIFFSISVWTMAKINKMSASIRSDKTQVHIYIKLSTLTGIFWILAILGDVLQQQVLFFISIVLNASQGIFIFFSYVANKRVLQLWKGKIHNHQFIYPAKSRSPNQTRSSNL